MEPLEIEVKFYLTNMNSVRDAIMELGAVCKGRVFESNIIFEDVNGSLMRQGFLLRLRKDRTAKLTFKSETPETDNQFKIRRELEVEVSDFSTMLAILESLGFHKAQIYEKWRETFVLSQGIHFCLDTMPYGDFLEIEGGKEDIRKMADQLGLNWKKRILASYLGIFGFIRRQSDMPFSDLTFDHFKESRFKESRPDFEEYIRVFEADTL